MQQIALLCCALCLWCALNTAAARKVYVPVGNGARGWDQQYKNGQWDYLEQIPAERARSAVIIGTYYQMFAFNRTVLDVGCGSGLLSDSLHPFQRRLYTGIDISAEAIRQGREKRPRIRLFQSKAEDYTLGPTEPKYGMVIFNEVIYYLDHIAMFEKYSAMLAPDGHIVISVWGTEKNHLMREELDKAAESVFKKVDEMLLTGSTTEGRTVTFKVALFKLK